MSDTSLLPLGSIVILKGTLKKLMVVNRANVVDNQYFDYGAVLYPEGLIDSDLAYFNQADILKTVATGFSDSDDQLMVDQLLTAKRDFLAKPKTDEQIQPKAEDNEDPFASVGDMGEFE